MQKGADTVSCFAASGRTGRVLQVSCEHPGVHGFFCAKQDYAANAAGAALLLGSRKDEVAQASLASRGGERLSAVPLVGAVAAAVAGPLSGP